MGALSTDNIDAFWKKVITQFKKGLLKGAYVISRNGSSGYYPNHWYTIGAKEEKRKYEGKKIRMYLVNHILDGIYRFVGGET